MNFRLLMGTSSKMKPIPQYNAVSNIIPTRTIFEMHVTRVCKKILIQRAIPTWHPRLEAIRERN